MIAISIASVNRRLRKEVMAMARVCKKLLTAVLHLLLFVGKVLSELFGHSHPIPWFPPKVLQKMEREGVSYDDVLDVFWHGEPVERIPGMITRTYNNEYKIGMTYKRDEQTGDYVVLSAWKRPRKT